MIGVGRKTVYEIHPWSGCGIITANWICSILGRAEVPEDLREITMSSSSDEFYRQNMYSNFGEIGQTVKTLVQQFQAKAKSHQVSFHVTEINVKDSLGEHLYYEQSKSV